MTDKLKLSGFALLVFLVLFGIYTLWQKLASLFPKVPQTTAVVLPKDDSRQIIVDPTRHQLIVLDDKGGKIVTNLPDKPSVIDIKKNGQVTVTAQQIGFELRPFIGYGFADQMRGYMGADLGFYKAYDIGAFLSLPMQKQDSPRLGVKVSYNIWSHLQGFVGLDNKNDINAGFALRF